MAAFTEIEDRHTEKEREIIFVMGVSDISSDETNKGEGFSDLRQTIMPKDET